MTEYEKIVEKKENKKEEKEEDLKMYNCEADEEKEVKERKENESAMSREGTKCGRL